MESKAKISTEIPRSVDVAYTKLREAILRGELAQGAALVEAELASWVGVSRTPLREALTKLRNEGLVVLERYRKTYVASFSNEDVRETLELRAILEKYVAEKACSRLTQEELDSLSALDERMHRTLDLPAAEAQRQFQALNEEFHAVILRASQSRRARALLSTQLSVPFHSAARQADKTLLYLRRACIFHREILSALKRRDAAAAGTLMESHILSLINDDPSP